MSMRKQATETIRGTKKEAEAMLRQRLSEVDSGGHVAKDRQTVGQYMDYWMESYAAGNTTLRTQQGYRGYIRRYILLSIGGLPLQKLTPGHVQKVYTEMSQKGLSPTTVIQLHRILRQALSHAVGWEMLTRNVADAATPPKKVQKQMDMWDVATINEFLEIAIESRYHQLYHLAVLTGMRRSELCGLRWESVEAEGKMLSVVNTLQHITGRGLVTGNPKTARSRRSIALGHEATRLLRAIRSRQSQQRLSVGPIWQETGYVFTRPDGRPLLPDEVSKDFMKQVRRHGLPHMTLHGLRHAHATLLLTAGIHPKVVSERLGHSNIAITMDTYSHVLPGMQEAAAEALDRRLANEG